MGDKLAMRNQSALVRVLCTFVFALFSLFYLYYYQADLLMVMQHVFSKGQTHYNHFIGAILITTVLMIVQIGVMKLCRNTYTLWAFTFVPSAICLTMLTNVESDVDTGLLTFGSWVYWGPLAMLLFAALVYACHRTGFSELVLSPMSNAITNLWVNLLIVCLTCLSVCFTGNADKVYHTRIHAEQCIIDGRYDEALYTIQSCNRSDENLTMLACYALSKKKVLAESLFEYQPTGGSKAMMPDGANIKFEMISERLFYKYLGTWYRQKMSAMKYLDFQRRHNLINTTTADYLLCGYLLDKHLDAFAANVGKYYAVNDSTALPKHIKEALILYTHLHSSPVVVYKNTIMDADFQDFQKMQKAYADKRERQTALRDTYGNTYWYYYYY